MSREVPDEGGDVLIKSILKLLFENEERRNAVFIGFIDFENCKIGLTNDAVMASSESDKLLNDIKNVYANSFAFVRAKEGENETFRIDIG